ncbi:orphan sodium- and chloride-dependent neurotransmitter transporter NTT5 isoform X2 [Desmodus rotundus]|uniref:orphan sodium- and chloride-dependent neurotransmitter transporter NTT5 isoform X2 n=1 Tax=Desmodus rotundus TaxID=9430 RepID=UPI001E1BE8A3|nr:orphan sodium- and chloride-dependent neurotransmitter transporter NTT5 isoform X2 [Desmodus rotundus]
MNHFEETEEKELQTSGSPSLRLTTKEILASKNQSSFAQTKSTETLLIQLAFSIGLGNLWRFPYLCHQNGGGDFILMYLFMLLLFGIPLLYMEMIVGQWLHTDNIQMWKQLIPWMGGIGYANILVCVLVSLYHSVIISWSFDYLGRSFHHPLPWTECPRTTDRSFNVTRLSCLNTVSHQYFWYHITLNTSSHMEEGIKALVPNLTLDIFSVWLLLFIFMSAGLKFSLPRLIFSIFLPYVVIFCLLIRGLFLEGAAASLRRMVTTELSAWASLDMWRQAGSHVLYSLGLGMGTVINIFCKAGGRNFIQVACLVALANLVTSLLTTSVIFIVLGFWTANSGQACVEKSVIKLMNLIDRGILPQDVKPPQHTLRLSPLDYLNWIENLPEHLKYQVVRFSPSCSIKALEEKFMQGPGLVFAAFSQAISLLPSASLWAILFFLILIVMGLSTLMKIMEGIVFPLQNSMFRQQPLLLSAVVCLGGFVGSLVFTSHPGSYIVSLFDEHVVPLTLVIIVAFQNVTLAWVYGANRFREEMYGDLGHLVWSFFVFLWRFVTLLGLLLLLTMCLMSLYRSPPPHYIAWNSTLSQEVKQPYLPSTLGWATVLSILTCLPIPVHPLRQWWYFQDHEVKEPFDKMQCKKLTLAPTGPSQWPKHHAEKASFKLQDRKGEGSSRILSLPLARASKLDSLWHFNLPWSRYSKASSGFSLPLFSSLTSVFPLRGPSLPPSRQVSPNSTVIFNSDRSGEAKEENEHKESLQ